MVIRKRPPVFQPAGSRSRTKQERDLDHDRKRSKSKPWRKWYKTAEWRNIRARRFAIDPLCVMCSKEGRVTAATDCDHIKPHRGDRALFFDFSNTQSLCAHCHRSTKQREENQAKHEKTSQNQAKPRFDPIF